MITLTELEQLYKTRQSCRSFQAGKSVSREQIESICKAALLAPSACNAQPWKLVAVVNDKAKELAKCLQDMGMNKFVSDAPVLIAVVAAKSNLTATVGGKLKDNDFTSNDLGILTAHLILAAEAAGLSTCILGWRNESKICKVLSLPKGTRIPEVIALGYAAEGYEIRPKKRKDFTDTLQIIE